MDIRDGCGYYCIKSRFNINSIQKKPQLSLILRRKDEESDIAENKKPTVLTVGSSFYQEMLIENRIKWKVKTKNSSARKSRAETLKLAVQALDRLVSLSCMHYCTSTCDLSTLQSARGLTSLYCGISHLEVRFTLRCLQRFSHPYTATQLCSWRNNWCTGGTSIPVLSY